MYKPKENKCISSFWRHLSKHLTSEGYFNPMRQAFQHTQEKLQDTMDQTVGMDHMMSCPDSSKAGPPKWNRLLRFSCKLPNYRFQGEKMQQRDKLQHHKTSNIHRERNLTMPCHPALLACLCKPSIFSCKLLTATHTRNTTEIRPPPSSKVEASIQNLPLKSRLQKIQSVKIAFPRIAQTGLVFAPEYNAQVYKPNTKYLKQPGTKQ